MLTVFARSQTKLPKYERAVIRFEFKNLHKQKHHQISFAFCWQFSFRPHFVLLSTVSSLLLSFLFFKSVAKENSFPPLDIINVCQKIKDLWPVAFECVWTIDFHLIDHDIFSPIYKSKIDQPIDIYTGLNAQKSVYRKLNILIEKNEMNLGSEIKENQCNMLLTMQACMHNKAISDRT